MTLIHYEWLGSLSGANAELHLRGKSQRSVRLPLPQDAGDALLAYIEKTRPRVPEGTVSCDGTRPVEASLRKAQHLTQVQLAQMLGISQQHMASFEKGVRKIPASMLPTLAQVFGVSVDTLLGVGEGKSKRGPTPRLHQQLEQLVRLPRAKQRFVMQMLDTVLQQSG